MPKTVKGRLVFGPLRFFNDHYVAKFQKKSKGLETEKFPKKTINESFLMWSCGLKRDLSRGKKAPALSHNTCLSQV